MDAATTPTQAPTLIVNCRTHGPSPGYLSRAEGRTPWTRCMKCHDAATRKYRRSRAKTQGARKGEIFNGLRTTAGVETEKRLIPTATKIMEWVQAHHADDGVTMGLMINRMLAESIARRDPNFDKGVVP